MRCKLTTVILIGLLTVPNLCAQDDTPALKPSPLDGTWKYVSQTNRGRTFDIKLFADTTIVIQGGLRSTFTESAKLPDQLVTLDDSVTPHRIELRSLRAGVSGKLALWKGIYKLEGDILTLCFDNEGLVYPTEFVSPEGKGNIFLSVLKREKK